MNSFSKDRSEYIASPGHTLKLPLDYLRVLNQVSNVNFDDAVVTLFQQEGQRRQGIINVTILSGEIFRHIYNCPINNILDEMRGLQIADSYTVGPALEIQRSFDSRKGHTAILNVLSKRIALPELLFSSYFVGLFIPHSDK